MKDEVVEMKKEVKNLKEQSLAMELIQDYKKANKRQFIIILLILTMWFCTIGYLVYILNDIGYEEVTTETYDVTQEVDDVNTINGNVINRGK